MAVDVREPELNGAAELRSAYEAKARAELADADALIGARPGAWDGEVVGPRIAFVVARRSADGSGFVDATTAGALEKAAGALGASGSVFMIASWPVAAATSGPRCARLRLALEAVDAPVVIALDQAGAEDLAAAFDVPELRPGHPVRAFGRHLGAVGDFAASLGDADAKSRAWIGMKSVAAAAGLETKGRPKAP